MGFIYLIVVPIYTILVVFTHFHSLQSFFSIGLSIFATSQPSLMFHLSYTSVFLFFVAFRWLFSVSSVFFDAFRVLLWRAILIGGTEFSSTSVPTPGGADRGGAHGRRRRRRRRGGGARSLGRTHGRHHQIRTRTTAASSAPVRPRSRRPGRRTGHATGRTPAGQDAAGFCLSLIGSFPSFCWVFICFFIGFAPKFLLGLSLRFYWVCP